MDCEFAEFLGLNGCQVSQQRAQVIQEKEESNLPNAQSTDTGLPPSRQRVSDCLETVRASRSELQEAPLDSAKDS